MPRCPAFGFSGSEYTRRSQSETLVEALRERGWVEGSNIAFEWRAEDSDAQVQEYVANTPTDVRVTGGPHPLRGAMRATSAIPIIAVDLEADPVASGFVKTPARPGGNVTGMVCGWICRRSRASRSSSSGKSCRCSTASASSGTIGSGNRSSPIGEVMKHLLVKRPQAIVRLTAPVVFASLPRIAQLARQGRVPSISPFSPYPGSGGMMAYGPDFPAMWRQVACYVDRVLRGARAGDLPVERPSKFSLIVNLKTAKDIGLTIPQSLILAPTRGSSESDRESSAQQSIQQHDVSAQLPMGC